MKDAGTRRKMSSVTDNIELTNKKSRLFQARGTKSDFANKAEPLSKEIKLERKVQGVSINETKEKILTKGSPVKGRLLEAKKRHDNIGGSLLAEKPVLSKRHPVVNRGAVRGGDRKKTVEKTPSNAPVLQNIKTDVETVNKMSQLNDITKLPRFTYKHIDGKESILKEEDVIRLSGSLSFSTQEMKRYPTLEEFEKQRTLETVQLKSDVEKLFSHNLESLDFTKLPVMSSQEIRERQKNALSHQIDLNKNLVSMQAEYELLPALINTSETRPELRMEVPKDREERNTNVNAEEKRNAVTIRNANSNFVATVSPQTAKLPENNKRLTTPMSGSNCIKADAPSRPLCFAPNGSQSRGKFGQEVFSSMKARTSSNHGQPASSLSHACLSTGQAGAIVRNLSVPNRAFNCPVADFPRAPIDSSMIYSQFIQPNATQSVPYPPLIQLKNGQVLTCPVTSAQAGTYPCNVMWSQGPISSTQGSPYLNNRFFTGPETSKLIAEKTLPKLRVFENKPDFGKKKCDSNAQEFLLESKKLENSGVSRSDMQGNSKHEERVHFALSKSDILAKESTGLEENSTDKINAFTDLSDSARLMAIEAAESLVKLNIRDWVDLQFPQEPVDDKDKSRIESYRKQIDQYILASEKALKERQYLSQIPFKKQFSYFKFRNELVKGQMVTQHVSDEFETSEQWPDKGIDLSGVHQSTPTQRFYIKDTRKTTQFPSDLPDKSIFKKHFHALGCFRQ